MDNGPGEEELGDEDGGHTQREGQVLGFVTEGVHAQQTAYAAADGCGEEQGFFRDAPAAFPCFLLVDQHKQEAQRIDYKQVESKVIHKKFLSGGVMLKKWLVCAWILLFLAGCGTQEKLETVSDVYTPQTIAAGEIVFDLPGDAAEEVFASEQDGTLYLCDNYTITVQTLPGGDLSRTLQTVTGYTAEQLTVLQTRQDDLDSYRTVWTAAGEGGDQLGRAVIIGDGHYHYVLAVMADAADAGVLSDAWKTLFDSFAVSRTGS